MPSAEEFAPRGASGVMTPERMQELRDRASAVRRAQASGVPIPGTEYATTAPAPVPVQPPAQFVSGMTVAAQHAPTYQPTSELDLVRQRFKLASYYEALIAEPIFGDDVLTDPYAAQVHAEVTTWASNRMAELAGIRDNPEGFLDEEVRLLKALALGLGPDGVRALLMLTERILNPPVAPTTQPTLAVQSTAPQPAALPAEPEPEEDQGSSAMSLAVAPQQAGPMKPKQPRVRRARVPGAPVVQQGGAPASEPAAEAPRRGRRTRSADPLEAGRALVASQGQPATSNVPAPTQGGQGGQGGQAAPPAQPTAAQQSTAAPHAAPVPMPRGLGMTMAMEVKAGEALRDAKIIETTGGGVL